MVDRAPISTTIPASSSGGRTARTAATQTISPRPAATVGIGTVSHRPPRAATQAATASPAIQGSLIRR